MFGRFWGDHIDGKLARILDQLDNEMPVKVLQLHENGKYGSPHLLIGEKPSDEMLEKLSEFYDVKFFRNDNDKDDFKYLMVIETLRYAYEEKYHFDKDSLSQKVTGNKYEFDGYFVVTDKHCDYTRIAIFPFSSHAYEVSGGYNLSKNQALMLCRDFVRRLNSGDMK